MDNYIALGIKRVMAEKGMYQKYVAEKAGFSEQQLSDMLNGRKIIRAEYIPQISKALEVNVAELFAMGKEAV